MNISVGYLTAIILHLCYINTRTSTINMVTMTSLFGDAIVWVNIAQCKRENFLEFCHACFLLRLELQK